MSRGDAEKVPEPRSSLSVLSLPVPVGVPALYIPETTFAATLSCLYPDLLLLRFLHKEKNKTKKKLFSLYLDAYWCSADGHRTMMLLLQLHPCLHQRPLCQAQPSKCRGDGRLSSTSPAIRSQCSHRIKGLCLFKLNKHRKLPFCPQFLFPSQCFTMDLHRRAHQNTPPPSPQA